MKTTSGLVKWKTGQIFFAACLLATACNQQKTPPESQTKTSAQSEAVEKWMAKRSERRPAAPVVEEAAPPVAVTPPIAETKPIVPDPTSAPKVSSKEDFSKRLSAIVGSAILSDKELREKAERGDKAAQRDLGRSIASSGSYQEAAQWYRKAADQGDALAQHDLAVLYVHGLGVPQDFAEAIVLFLMAAAQGDVDSQYSLGLRYLKGEHVEQNFAEAAKFFGMAAEQGNADAMLSYGRRFAAGEGVEKDVVEAYKWYVLAADNGKYGADDVRDSMAKQMTPEQIVEAKRRVAAFVPKKKK